jgi:dienelactone hydrolase
MRPPAPRLRTFGHPTGVRAAVLVLHGGQEDSKRRAHPLRPAYLRMLPFAHDLRRAGRDHGVAVGQLCDRYQGWNAPDLDPVSDAEWAIEELHRAHPGVPVALVGHSMGARVAFRVAGDPSVVAVCALAPWVTADDPVDQLAGRSVLIAHGDRDTTTDPAKSHAYAERLRRVTDQVRVVDIPGDGHAMLRKAPVWTLLVRRFVLTALGAQVP